MNSDVGGLQPPILLNRHRQAARHHSCMTLCIWPRTTSSRARLGRKVLVLITDGEDQGSRYNIKQAIEAAQKADALIYSFFYVDRQILPALAGRHHVRRCGNAGALRQMSDDTCSGQRFPDRSQDDATKCVRRAKRRDAQPRRAGQYIPTNPAKDGTFIRKENRTGNKDWKVQARKGYYAINPDKKNYLSQDAHGGGHGCHQNLNHPCASVAQFASWKKIIPNVNRSPVSHGTHPMPEICPIVAPGTLRPADSA